MATILDIKNTIRNPYAWPGGYPLYMIADDGGCICTNCAKDNFKLIADSVIRGISDGWKVVAIDINYEDDSLHCGNCNTQIESAYGEDE